MVVLQPIKPGTPRFSGLALKRGRARRALSLLGSNDAKANLQLAESLMTISAEEFAAKWNFDPVRSVPTSDLARPQQAGGREARVSAGGKGAAADSSVDHECSPRTCGCGAEVAAKGGARGEEAQQEALEARRRPSADADSGIESDESIHLSSPSPPSPSSSPKQDSQPRLRQTCITEFVRPKKRLTFSSKDQQAAHTTQSKKRSASSLQDHLQPPHKKVLLQLRA